jgi:hypothetical protein
MVSMALNSFDGLRTSYRYRADMCKNFISLTLASFPVLFTYNLYLSPLSLPYEFLHCLCQYNLRTNCVQSRIRQLLSSIFQC